MSVIINHQLSQLRSLTKDCINNHQLSTAGFYAEKCCSLSNDSDYDIFMCAKIYFISKQFHRCIHHLQNHNLLPNPSEMSDDNQPFHQKLFKKLENESIHEMINENKSKESIYSLILDCLLLGMQAFVACGEYGSAVLVLGNSDEYALQIISKIQNFIKDNIKCHIKIDSNIFLARAKALQKLKNDKRTLFWLKNSLISDPKNIEV